MASSFVIAIGTIFYVTGKVQQHLKLAEIALDKELVQLPSYENETDRDDEFFTN
jgi:hypothetical protein